MLMILLIIFVMIIWATLGDIADNMQGGTTYKENNVNNYYNDCGIDNKYEGKYNVNNKVN